MVLNHISTVLRQARLTFTSSSETFRSNLEILKHLLDKTTAADVNLHPQFMTESLWMKPDKAPVTYIGIYENELLTMGIFILSPDMKLPLHDHPQMYGLIKVLFGKIKVTSFTVSDDPSSIYSNDPPLNFKAEKHPDEFMETVTTTCVLDPKQRNIHEIESVEGPAAFLDILSPPYCSRENPNNTRKCTYFKVLEHLGGNVFRLNEINPPNWYWNDTYLYEGPQVVQQKSLV
ncbi:PCO-ADO [Popillia japonica]|uniref:PCO-ADO n=1 Tax=Popillia japonica TaxID=7064 RepID=A0AAW1LVJ3_POPJA